MSVYEKNRLPSNFDYSGHEKSSLGNIGELASPPAEQNALNRFFVLHKMRSAHEKIGVRHEVFGCHCAKIPTYRTDKATGKRLKNQGVPENIELHRYQNGGEIDAARHGLVGVKRCASAMVCPVCGSIIRYRRQLELVQIGEILIGRGYGYFFGTYTAQHDYHTSLYDFVLRFQAAQKYFKSGKIWQNLKRDFGIEWEARTVEVTDDNPLCSGRKSGWHFHSHSVIWTKNPIILDSCKKELSARLAVHWVNCCRRVGLVASIERGCVVEFPHTRGGDVADIKPLAQYLSKKIGYELTGDILKDGRLSRRVSVWEILRMAAETGDARLWARWGEYMRGIKRVHFLRLTAGLREFCGLNENSDGELLEGETAERVYEFLGHSWLAVTRQGGQRKIVVVADHAEKMGVDVSGAIDEAIQTAQRGGDILTGEILLE